MPHKEPRPAASGADRAAGLTESGLEHPFSRLLPPKNPAPALALAEIKFQRAFAKLHRLGPRPLAELAARHLLQTEIEAAVDRFVTLNPPTVAAVGARKWPPPPLHRVRR